MVTNCSVPLSLIHRATATWAQRSRLPLRRHISHQNNSTNRSYYSAASATTTNFINPLRKIENGNVNSIVQRPNFRLTHATNNTASIGRARTMVMVTQTKSSDKDDEQTNNNTAQPTDDTIEAATTVEGEIGVTASCAARIKQLASTRPNPDAVYLRLYVDAGGCSGFQYKFLLLSEDNDAAGDDDEEEDGTIDPEEDVTFVKDGMRVVIDQTSLDLLKGSTIDYVQEMIRSSFAVVANPQSESACGCGSSFAVKNFEANPALD